MTILGPSLTNATLAIGLGATPTYIRLTRGLVLSTKEEDYVQGARALGAGDLRVMGRHILPNIASALLVQATVAIPTAIIAEAVLSFLGLGVQPPAPSWGTMLERRPAVPRAGARGWPSGRAWPSSRWRCRSTSPATACATCSTRRTREMLGGGLRPLPIASPQERDSPAKPALERDYSSMLSSR